ncbi:MAG TPA: hypothetical protein VK446_16205 [Methylocystis sp.]|nr:hypothetical protein [Methylocystis sp.]
MTALLADLLRRALESHGEYEVFDAAAPNASPPDVIILGPSARAGTARVWRRRFPDARIIVLAADLSRFRGPKKGGARELTLESLLAAFRR